MSTPSGYQFLYIGPRGTVKHLVPESVSPSNAMASARCGRHAGGALEREGAWFGTGNWSEIERLATLPTCKRCARLHEIDELRRERMEDFRAGRITLDELRKAAK